ncbi:MAG: M24 family metallopeptidase [Candidatus Omnitrophica bacterium]|nr:M24 family metallopeptidase [Candidatus Omnitrophota bacterium]
MILNEIKEKEDRIRQLMKKEGLTGILLSRQDNFAWFTCGGDSHVLTATESGVASILVTLKNKYILTNNIESGRIMDEEVKKQGFILKSYFWEDEKKAELIKDITGGRSIGSDDSFSGAKNISNLIAPLRYSLVKEEIARYRRLGKETGECMAKVAKSVRPGMTEFEVAGHLSEELYSAGVTPIVLLMAADERISKYRHPIPTDKKIKKCIMIVCCARKWGLIVSMTRLVNFGSLSRQLREKHNAVVKVDAALNSNTVPGNVICDVFKEGLRAYKDTGFSEEWRLHHQGGPTGYAARDFKGTTAETRRVLVNQAFAWNPSITGTKSEDTTIAMPDNTEFVSETPGWPMLEVEYNGKILKRPDILKV